MSIDLKSVLGNKAINGWNLFWLISVPMCIVLILEMLATDISTPRGASHMIGYSVRFAVPVIFLVTAISALQKLFPGAVSNWLLRNRKYIGLVFAVAMAWQGAFIGMMSYVYRDYYFENIFYFRDELEGSTGYLFLTAMVLTSFKFGRKLLNPQQWRLLHLSGLYFLWAYPFSTYWWTVAGYYGNAAPHDYVFYVIGFSVFALRIVAWGKQRRQSALKAAPDSSAPVSYKVLGGAAIAFGLYAAATVPQWQTAVTEFLTIPAWSENLSLWLPFWPYEPFLPLFIIGIGTMLWTWSPASVKDEDLEMAGAGPG